MATTEWISLWGDAVSLDNFTFNGIGHDGANFLVDVMEGWDDSPDPTLVMEDRPNRNGAYITPRTNFRARMVTIEGAIWAQTRADFETGRAAFRKAVTHSRTMNLTRVVNGVPMTLAVRLGGRISFDNDIETGCRFSLPVIAPNPEKLSASTASLELHITSQIVSTRTAYPRTYPRRYTTVPGGGSGGVVYPELGTYMNTGNATYYPSSVVTGPLNRGWRINNETTGESLLFDFAVLPNQRVFLDHRERTATLDNGANTRIENKAYGTWWGLEPGNNTFRLRQDLYASAATFQIIDARSAVL